MKKMKKFLFKLKNIILYLLFPRTCFNCGIDLPSNEQGFLCKECLKKLKKPGPIICQRCGITLKDGGAHCFNCRGTKAKHFKCSLIRSALDFNEPSRSLIHGLKYEKYTNIAKFFAPLMYKTLLENPDMLEAEYFVSVPIHKKRLKKRGFNQAEVLARELSTLANIPYLNALTRIKNTKSQTKLTKKERTENIKEAFVCSEPKEIKRKAIILIDDVCTTGATLEECAKVLKKAGAREVYALCATKE